MSTPSSSTTIWAHRELSFQESDLTGYKVEAQDGSIGKIDDATYQVGADHIVVDTGPWILGKKVMIPAGLIERIDGTEEKVYVDRTKEQIKDSPKLDKSSLPDEKHRSDVGGYYG